MLRSVLLKSLRDQRRALLWWTLGFVGLALVVVLFYPSVSSVPELGEILKEAPEALLQLFGGEIANYTSPAGYLTSELFFLMAPLMFLIFAVALGSGAIAGEEDRGTLNWLLSLPLARSRVVVEKFGAMTIAVLALAVAFWLGLVIGTLAVGMDISLGRLAEMTLSAMLLALAFGSLALALGCATGNRGISLGIASALAVATYLLNTLAPLVEGLEPYRVLSPFYYYIGADPLVNGLSLGHAGVLIGLTAVLLAVSLVAFRRRDISA